MAEKVNKDNNNFLLVYASQTGQAKAIAEEIADSAPNYGLKANLFCMSLTDKRFCLEKETCAVFIVSTAGDGEAPDTAAKLVRRLTRHTLKKTYLENLNYALLALGDSNYIKFCLFGRLFEKRLTSLSAKPFYPTGYGDDAFGIETAVDPWIQNLWPALQKQLNVNSTSSTYFEIPQNLVEITNKCDFFNMSASEVSHHCTEDCTLMCSLIPVLKDFNPETSQVPKLPVPNIIIQYNDVSSEITTSFVPNESLLVSRATPLAKVSIIAARKLTAGEDVKRTMELTVEFQRENVFYQPGDSFGFLCPNSDEEVNFLIDRLQLHLCADRVCNIHLHPNCTNKRKLPSHIQPDLTLRDMLLHCIEIRSVPKKIFLRVLAEYTKDSKEKLCLLFLSSVSSSSLYAEYIRKPSICIVDILMNFKSCQPPIEKLIEYLPPLKPRFYSVASSPLENDSCFKIVFNVLKFVKGEGRLQEREGVCTGWMTQLSSKFATNTRNVSNITNGLSSLSLDSQPSFFVYKRKNEHFHLPINLEYPIIMIGPGTGIAPFMSFLLHREKLMKSKAKRKFGEAWLFYGCRYKENDFLYKDKLQKLLDSKVLNHLIVSFSRETSSENACHYVHENIKRHAEEINCCISEGGIIYVCGDAKYMAHDVQQAFIDVFQSCKGLREAEAKSFVEKLQKEHRYINDVWI